MDGSRGLPHIRQIYSDYIDEATDVYKARKPTDGLLGFGRSLSNHPCNDAFIERLKKAAEDFAAAAPESGETLEVMTFMTDEPLKHRDIDMIYWMLLAVQSLSEQLVPFLSAQDAAGLEKHFREGYPKSVRLPAQKALAGALRRQAGACYTPPKGLRGRWQEQFGSD